MVASDKARHQLLISDDEALADLVPLVTEAVRLRGLALSVADYRAPLYETVQRDMIKWRSCVVASLAKTFSDGEALGREFLQPVRLGPYELPAAERLDTILNALQDRLEAIIAPVDRGLVPLKRQTNGLSMVPLLAQLSRFADGLSRIRAESKRGPDGPRLGYRLSNEYDVQDALWVLIRPQFPDAVDESPTPKVGLTWSRIDIWLPSHKVAIEVKFARSANDGKRIDGELKKDFIDYQAAGARAVVVVVAEAPGVFGLEQLENLAHTVTSPVVRVIRVRL